ncbi:methionyl-tRNA formyltransferase [Corynebacterium sp. zg254]|uniref:Methionyl-tRNA formyltransferase n=1 Tax=Corynebacterium zhongnanshanii TaxID=2768834 RepID=A0ABQ6VGS1_9CORY|nr:MULTISPECIES: methionyl-tRNA formyltransferase [Corynebacterium]KAB3523460.1 methionyl-tRNA formyltransferase [Corynebacterium zhongnanshanii]MCR5913399.1 methionyl-tRNA formyltransferase [Corynebacterium sp. zg254]
MKIIFAGTPEPAAVVLEHLLTRPDIEVLAVVTQPDAQRGRGRSLYPSKVAEVAAAHELPTYKWSTLKADTPDGQYARASLEALAEQGATAAAVVAYGNLIPRDLLDVFQHGWINLHYSLLPRWRGAAPVQAAIAEGDATTGASTFRIAAGMDTGPMIDAVTEPIGIEDTADDLLTRLTYSGRELLAQSLNALENGTAELTPQEDAQATHASKISSADAQIDWGRSAHVIQRVARAHTPAPGAWTVLKGQRVKIGMMLPVPEDQGVSLRPGELHASKKELLVGTGEGLLKITRIQPPGKKMMNAADWARGQQELLSSGACFERRDGEER